MRRRALGPNSCADKTGEGRLTSRRTPKSKPAGRARLLAQAFARIAHRVAQSHVSSARFHREKETAEARRRGWRRNTTSFDPSGGVSTLNTVRDADMNVSNAVDGSAFIRVDCATGATERAPSSATSARTMAALGAESGELGGARLCMWHGPHRCACVRKKMAIQSNLLRKFMVIMVMTAGRIVLWPPKAIRSPQL
jgi:hypothetical protein